MEKCLCCDALVLKPYAYVSQKATESEWGEFVLCSYKCACQFSRMEKTEKLKLIDYARATRITE